MSIHETDIEGPLSAVEYLARSPSRVRVLSAINGTPRSRAELGDLTDVSRVTLSRILATFEEHEWVVRTDQGYEATNRGRVLAEAFDRLLSNVAAVEDLGDTVEWLPVERFEFDLACLGDARVTTSSWSDHTASIRRVADRITTADRVSGTASGVSREVVGALRDAAVDGDGSYEAILDDTALSIVRGESDLAGQFREMLAAGVDLYGYDGPDPLLMVMVCDDAVILCGHDGDGPPPGTLETTDGDVLAWAERYVDSVRTDATRLEADAFGTGAGRS